MITKKNLLLNFIFRASADKKINTYYHLLEPLFHAMSDNNILYTVGYACALAETLDNTNLDQLIYGKFVEDWIND